VPISHPAWPSRAEGIVHIALLPGVPGFDAMDHGGQITAESK